ncbi:ferric reductase-like transmembrane domain-containing protein [Jannaschia donghaensis]|uniref:Ferric reductase like transmembrane component n=1 Tax=Jannaschia donghaensis TaxID=420998 RepID=A0A0M6YFU3_9RHOB|nr:ferric reductase-like transmembrane domain-containing protein [Jannaschia donghaensis]CTQ48804.1 Ferric reductase like transmembrane component [Jannaschia donghaensis]
MTKLRAGLAWGAVALAVVLPIGIAANSPLLQWRDAVYVTAGFAGILGLALLLLQPLLAAALLPGLATGAGRRIHRWLGAGLVAAIVVHVGGLWLTSPPDVIDALTLRSPTPFSLWGVIAMWAAFAAATLALVRKRLPLRIWRLGHTTFVVLVVAGTVVHAVLIVGAMGTVSKIALCALVIAATVAAVARRRVWAVVKRRGD